MIKSNKFNGDKLKSARQYRGKGIDILSKESNIKKEDIEKFELSKSIPNLEQVLSFSKILKVPREYFYGDIKLNINIEKIYLQSKILSGNEISSCSKDELAYIEKILITHRIYNFIEMYISFPNINVPVINKYDSMEDIVKTVRKAWGIDDKPVYNVLNLLESNGFIISTINNGKNSIGSFTVKNSLYDKDRYFIALGNDKKSISKRNYDLSFEIGKILLEDVNKAKDFAKSFLLPEDKFIESIENSSQLEDYIELKAKWLVPISILISRAYDLGKISGRKYDYLNKELKKLGWSKKEPLDNIKATNPILSKTAIDLIGENDIIKLNSIVRILGENGINLYQEDIEDLLNLKNGKLSGKNNEDTEIIQNKNVKVINFKR